MAAQRPRFNRFLISHGSLRIGSSQMNYAYSGPTVTCPDNMNIVLFQDVGRYSYFNEMGLIENYIINYVEDQLHPTGGRQPNPEAIMNLDNTVLRIPLENAKDYMCQIYQPRENNVPNIIFRASDDDVQCGVYKFNSEKAPMTKNCTNFDISPTNGGYWPIFDNNYMDHNIMTQLCGQINTTRLSGALPHVTLNIYNQPFFSLESVCQVIAGHPTIHCTLYILSCQSYLSTPIDELKQASTLLDASLTACSQRLTAYWSKREYINMMEQILVEAINVGVIPEHIRVNLAATRDKDQQEFAELRTCLDTVVTELARHNQIRKTAHQEFEDMIAKNPVTPFLRGRNVVEICTNDDELLRLICNNQQIMGYMLQLFTKMRIGGGKKISVDIKHYKKMIDQGANWKSIVNQLKKDFV